MAAPCEKSSAETLKKEECSVEEDELICEGGGLACKGGGDFGVDWENAGDWLCDGSEVGGLGVSGVFRTWPRFFFRKEVTMREKVGF